MPKKQVNSWFKARDLADKARDKDHGFVLDGSTRVRVSHDKHGYRPHAGVAPSEAIYAIVHHSTEIAYYYPNGDVGINLHGWDTVTTKRRIYYHAQCRTFSNRGVTWLVGSNMMVPMMVPMECSKEYIVRKDCIIDPSGFEIRYTGKSSAPRALPKSRNPATTPIRGDLLRDPEGAHWLVARHGRHGKLCLSEYRGDFPANRAYSALTGRTIELNPLFLLSVDGWTAVTRFELKKEVTLGK
jgi:hypothetical protein